MIPCCRVRAIVLSVITPALPTDRFFLNEFFPDRSLALRNRMERVASLHALMARFLTGEVLISMVPLGL